MKDNLMIDLETLGTSPDSAILSIGAVFFDKDGLGEEFYVNVNLESCMRVGLKIDPSTFYWWLKQDSNAQKALTTELKNVTPAVESVDSFIRLNCDIKKIKVWGNGSDFDNVILSNFMQSIGTKQPWGFWNNRCFRTYVAENKIDRVYPDNAHNSLEDAKAQAQTLINYWNKQQCNK